MAIVGVQNCQESVSRQGRVSPAIFVKGRTNHARWTAAKWRSTSAEIFLPVLRTFVLAIAL